MKSSPQYPPCPLSTRDVARTLRLTRATNRHLDRITRLHLAGLVDSGSLSLDPALDADLVDVEASYADGLFIVAAFDDEPDTLVGMGAIRCIGDEWHVKRMRVEAAHRRLGIAQAVLDRLLEEARTLGVATLVLDTSIKQEAAQRLYERNGFVHTGNVEIGGIPSRLYRLTLA
jgi:GNAT superfamily N-acetyltransferase